MNNYLKRMLSTALVAVTSAVLAVFIYTKINPSDTRVVTVQEETPVSYANMPVAGGQTQAGLDFTLAAEKSVNAVVHVKTKYTRGGEYYSGNPLYDFFFGDRGFQEPQPAMASGSGVIISKDGYIVTNNHVIQDANEIEVVLNDNRTFVAELIGSDSNTDIALLKIKGENFPALTYGDSDRLKIGEWVLAVGNPFNLTSTVTAGIVSAKGRSIGIMSGRMPVESFIQTDAAVNPGNSGGALVNTRGELVGINTAIASRTGSYSGYSFAVPVSIVKKVVSDIIEYGEVQRAYLGVRIAPVNAQLAKEKDIKKIEGIYIDEITPRGSAMDAGLEAGDIILSIEGVKVNRTPELLEQLGRYRPGDKVEILVRRGSKEKNFEVLLRNQQGTTSVIKQNGLEVLGAEFGEISDDVKRRLRVSYGIQVDDVTNGKFKQNNIREGYVITKINGRAIRSVKEIKEEVQNTEGVLFITGIYPNGRVAYYAVDLRDE